MTSILRPTGTPVNMHFEKVAVALFLFFATTHCQKLEPNGDCVKSLVKSEGNVMVCSYNWNITYKDTMVFYNKTTGSGVPVVIRNGKFFKRVLRRQTCGELTEKELTKGEIDEVLTADGSYTTAMVVNGQLPGPPIIVRNGTQVVVNVTNNLHMEGISIHWHGMVQRNTPWMDGVGSVSHCPINPGETFTYRFLATPEGTHWYHSHLGTQRTDGLYGALIVLPNEDNKINSNIPDIEGEFIILLHDWMGEPSLAINNRILWELERFTPGYNNTDQCYYQTRQSDGTEIGVTPFVSGLINGKGRRYDADGKAEISILPLAIFNVSPKKAYHFRLISAAMMYAFRVSIDQHDLHVFATDGNQNKPLIAYESIIINSGERFDFYIHTVDASSDYWIRAETMETSNIKDESVSMGRAYGILNYNGSVEPTSHKQKCTKNNKCVVVNCPFSNYPPTTQYENIICVPITNLTAPSKRPPPKIHASGSQYEEHFINFHFSGNVSQRSSVNGRQFIAPSTPPMTLPTGDIADYMTVCDDEDCIANHCKCTYYIELGKDNVVQMVLLNIRPGEGLNGTSHPVHFHGHHFYVLKTGYGNYYDNGTFKNDTTDIRCEGEGNRCNKAEWSNSAWGSDNIPGLNLVDPPIKDTVIVPVGGYVVIRFLADNPGWWFVHCHIEIHQVEGMALMLKEGTTDDMNPPPKDFKTCGTFRWSEEEFWKKLKGPTSDSKDSSSWKTVAIILMIVLGLIVLIAIAVGINKCRKRIFSSYKSV